MAALSPQLLRIAAAVIIALLLQTTLVPHLSLWGVHAELLLATTLAVSLVAGTVRSVIVGFIGGLLADSLTGLPIGITSLAYCLVAIALSVAAEHASEVWWARSLLAFTGSLLSVFLVVLLASMFGHPVIGSAAAIKVGLVVGAFNAFVAPLVAKGVYTDELRREREGLVW